MNIRDIFRFDHMISKSMPYGLRVYTILLSMSKHMPSVLLVIWEVRSRI